MSLEAFISQDNTVLFVDDIRKIKMPFFSKSSCSLPIFGFEIEKKQKLNPKMGFNHNVLQLPEGRDFYY